MIIVTGAAGFIGSNLVHALNRRGERDIVAVDNLSRADKFHNLVDCEIADYLDKQELLARLPRLGPVRAIFHQGACSDTMESDGRYMMENNFRYSQSLLEFAAERRIPFVYASSAAVYGGSKQFVEEREFERPLNVYGYSKFLFDQVVRRRLPSAGSQVVGLRYFNVYGPREAHKGRMASVALHNVGEFRANGKVDLFGGWDGWGVVVTACSSQGIYVATLRAAGPWTGSRTWPESPATAATRQAAAHSRRILNESQASVTQLQRTRSLVASAAAAAAEGGLVC